MISDTESNNGNEEKQDKNINLGLGTASNKSVWQNIGSVPVS
jgi:hypothetical protein